MLEKSAAENLAAIQIPATMTALVDPTRMTAILAGSMKGTGGKSGLLSTVGRQS
jgi:hypothetical protein